MRRLAIFFGLVYSAQGVCHIAMLMNQPIRAYLKDVDRLSTTQIAEFFFVAQIPWMLKPLYGLISDFLPLFGYRRKSYIVAAASLAALGFAVVAATVSSLAILPALFVTGIGIAAADVLVDGLMVEASQRTGATRFFQGMQWTAFQGAAIGAALLGSLICASYSADPGGGVRTAALLAIVLPVVVIVLTWQLVSEERVNGSRRLRETGRALLDAVRSVQLWIVAGFLCLVCFNPGTITPLYEFLVDERHIDRAYLAVFDASYSAGSAFGALAFLLMARRFPLRRFLAAAIGLSAIGMLPLAAIVDKPTGTAAFFVCGATGMLATLSCLSVAAEACPPRVEAFVFASLMSLTTLSTQYSDVLGARLYEGYVDHRIAPLILLSAAITATGIPLIRFLPRIGLLSVSQENV